MKIEKQKANEAFEQIKDLDKLLTERIADLHNVQGGMQSRHAYILYRDRLWAIRDLLTDSIKESKQG